MIHKPKEFESYPEELNERDALRTENAALRAKLAAAEQEQSVLVDLFRSPAFAVEGQRGDDLNLTPCQSAAKTMKELKRGWELSNITKNSEIDQLRQQLAAAERARDDWKREHEALTKAHDLLNKGLNRRASRCTN